MKVFFKQSMAVALAAAMLLAVSGCARRTAGPSRYEASFLTLFNTVTTLVGYAEDKESFTRQARLIYDELERYHQLYDIYYSYDGVANLHTVNQQAGVAPVAVDPAIIDLLLFSKEMNRLTGGKVNVAMGSVLSLWHDHRESGIQDPENAALPPTEALEAAAQHTSIDDVIIDEAAGTVYLSDPELRLDVGAIAKGYATQRACDAARAQGVTSMLVSVGGNVRAIGANDQGQPWKAGLQDPAGGGEYLHTVPLEDQTLVTSGSYQRYYTVDGTEYHHIIDPETLMPAAYFAAVTVLSADSGTADALSTALFNLDYPSGLALVESLPDTEALWIFPDGAQAHTPNFPL